MILMGFAILSVWQIYFGSVAAIYERFSGQEVGITRLNLYYDHDFDLSPYQNDRVIIRFGYLITKEGEMGSKTSVN